MYLKMLPPDGGIYAGTTGRQASHMRNHVLFFIVPHSLNLEQRAQLQIVNNLHGSP